MDCVNKVDGECIFNGKVEAECFLSCSTYVPGSVKGEAAAVIGDIVKLEERT